MGYTLTKLDIAALRQADRLVVAYNPQNASYRETSVRLIKEARKTAATPFPQEQEHTLTDCPVMICGGSYATISSEAMVGLVAFGMIGLYHSQSTPESSILLQLREGDEIGFEFHPDGHSNGYVAAAGLHTDVLLLTVHRGEGKRQKRLTFELAAQTSPNNSGRMIRGLPESVRYKREGARVRRETWTPPAFIDAPPEEAA